MTSIQREPTNRIDALMCARSLGPHDAPYTAVSSHLLASRPFQCPLDIGSARQRLYQQPMNVNPVNTSFEGRKLPALHKMTEERKFAILFAATILAALRQEDAKASCCTEDEGRSLGAAL